MLDRSNFFPASQPSMSSWAHSHTHSKKKKTNKKTRIIMLYTQCNKYKIKAKVCNVLEANEFCDITECHYMNPIYVYIYICTSHDTVRNDMALEN